MVTRARENSCALEIKSGVLAVCAVLLAAFHFSASAQTPKAAKTNDAAIPVRFTDVRKSAGITFLQDATATDEKNYLETMGTGVGWIDYDQDGLMDLYFVQSAATDNYKPPHPLRSALVSQQRRRNIHRRHRKSRRRRRRPLRARRGGR